ncbi:MucR family transcriptional regulator [Methylorubrum sp. Q1]|uniref:MucR family transcriptional regulator n=1 Tax=Methylorubrum sp. Q1 TaxID=2562453 RepID=UPI001076091C|nr:MucR family transcriptional regulator [Methylorubrum sp. Q1]TFZ55571.1 MucR family transcriptional regulator [Methylorubrum sp. Q1]
MTNDNATATFAEGHRLELAAEIVMAYVGHNVLPATELPGLIRSVHAALIGSKVATPTPTAEPEAQVEKATAVQIKKSITPDALISFIDGKPYKTLRRHITKHGHTPESYRLRFGLPADNPLVAASYSEQRAALAKAIGLGQPKGRPLVAA